MSAIEPELPKNRELLRRLIRDAFAARGIEPNPSQPDSACLRPSELYETVRARGTQLPRVSATELGKIRPEQLREECFAMKEVLVLDGNSPDERLWLRGTD